MMRYQRVSPDLLHLPSGKKPASTTTNHIPRACKEDEASYPLPRVRPGSASLVHTHFPPTSDPPPPEPQTSGNGNGRDMLLQWGHNKRSRGSRAESRAAGDDSTSSSRRQTIKVQRRAAAIAGAEKIAAAAAAMPPPCGGGYMRGANLRPCMPSSATNHYRTVEDRSGGQSRPEKNRSPPSPPEKPHSKPTAAAPRNGFGPDPASMNHPHHHTDSKAAVSDHRQDTSGATGKANMEQFEWPRIYVSLSRKEKEDDFLAMKGTKLPQRPKKRAKNIDRSLQYCFPGMWLSDLTRGRYEVREKKSVKKKPRGLKGMESMDSDSE